MKSKQMIVVGLIMLILFVGCSQTDSPTGSSIYVGKLIEDVNEVNESVTNTEEKDNLQIDNIG